MTRMQFRVVLMLALVGCSTRDLEYLRDGRSNDADVDGSQSGRDGSAGATNGAGGNAAGAGGGTGTADAHDDGPTSTGGTNGDSSLADAGGLAGGDSSLADAGGLGGGDSGAAGAGGLAGNPSDGAAGAGGTGVPDATVDPDANPGSDGSETGGPQIVLLCSFAYSTAWPAECNMGCGASGGTTAPNQDDQGGGGSVGSVDFMTTWESSGKVAQRARVFRNNPVFDWRAYSTMSMWVKVVKQGIMKSIQPFIMCGQDSGAVFVYGPAREASSLSPGSWYAVSYDMPRSSGSCTLDKLTAYGLAINPDTAMPSAPDAAACDAGSDADGDAEGGDACQSESGPPVSIEAEVLIDNVSLQ